MRATASHSSLSGNGYVRCVRAFRSVAPLFIGIAFAIRLTSRSRTFPAASLRQGRRAVPDLEVPHDASRCSGSVRRIPDGQGRLRACVLIGRFLHRTSLVELPQLINVVGARCRASGHRPHVPGMLAGGMLYEGPLQHFQRHRVAPVSRAWRRSRDIAVPIHRRGPCETPPYVQSAISTSFRSASTSASSGTRLRTEFPSAVLAS